MRTSIRSRLERLEAALAPKGRAFVFVDEDGPDHEARVAAFRAENGVGPHDELIIVHVRYE